jgi:hypothetical protein
MVTNLEPLLAAPVEALDVEYKGWLNLAGDDEHRGILAKTAIALANEGGGVIVVGVREERPNLISEPRPVEIAPYSQDQINNIIKRFASPSLHCRLSTVQHPVTGHDHAVIEVPGGFTSPVMSKSGTNKSIRPHVCYIRKPGPESAPPENHDDWHRLLERCLRNRREDMLNAIRDIVEGRTPVVPIARRAIDAQTAFADAARAAWHKLTASLSADAPARCPLGRYELDYALIGDIARPSLSDLLNKLRLVAQRRSSWPQFWVPTREEIEPVPIDDVVQCWLGTPKMGHRDPSNVDFWRTSPEGRMFLLRGYFEDAGGFGGREIVPGSILDLHIPIRQVAECLGHARALGALLAPDQELQVLFRARWFGTNGRRISSVDPQISFYIRDHWVSQQDDYGITTTVSTDEIRDNLPEIILPLLAPFYERFRFFSLNMDHVRHALPG